MSGSTHLRTVRKHIGRLNAPGRSRRQLLEVMALRRPDGSDIPMVELPTSKALARGETIIAEEVVNDGADLSTSREAE